MKQARCLCIGVELVERQHGGARSIREVETLDRQRQVEWVALDLLDRHLTSELLLRRVDDDALGDPRNAQKTDQRV